MAFVAADWSINRGTKVIDYIGADHTGAATYCTVLELHRALQDFADDASFTANDELDITDPIPSDRSTDNIVTLTNGYTITNAAAEHLYDGSIKQGTGGTEALFSGVVVVGSVVAGTKVQCIQNNVIIVDDFWNDVTPPINADATQNIITRFLVKTRNAGADTDGKRLRFHARELGHSYAEFSVTAGLGNATAALFTSTDPFNQTAEGTISGWTDIVNVEGYQALDVDINGSNEFYYSKWDRASRSINQLYERTKWIGRRGTATTIHGMNGELFRGITHQVTYTGETSGPFVEDGTLTWGSGATAGTGILLALLDSGTTGTLWIQLLTGVVPSGTITGGSTTATTGTVTARTVAPQFVGTSTGSAIIGAYGIGIEVVDLTFNDKLTALDNVQRNPPNVVTFTVNGLVNTEDRVIVAASDGGSPPNIDYDQLTLNTTLSSGTTTAIVATASIPLDTPASGTIRVQLNNGQYRLQSYTSYTGSTFTIPSTDYSGGNTATAPKNIFVSYIDKAAASTSESFQSTYVSDRTMFIRVRDGGGTPIKTFETTGILASSPTTVTAIRTSDA